MTPSGSVLCVVAVFDNFRNTGPMWGGWEEFSRLVDSKLFILNFILWANFNYSVVSGDTRTKLSSNRYFVMFAIQIVSRISVWELKSLNSSSC